MWLFCTCTIKTARLKPVLIVQYNHMKGMACYYDIHIIFWFNKKNITIRKPSPSGLDLYIMALPLSHPHRWHQAQSGVQIITDWTQDIPGKCPTMKKKYCTVQLLILITTLQVSVLEKLTFCRMTTSFSGKQQFAKW